MPARGGLDYLKEAFSREPLRISDTLQEGDLILVIPPKDVNPADSPDGPWLGLVDHVRPGDESTALVVDLLDSSLPEFAKEYRSPQLYFLKSKEEIRLLRRSGKP
jgi:hypothetical protein